MKRQRSDGMGTSWKDALDGAAGEMTDLGSKGERLKARAAGFSPRSSFGLVCSESITHGKWSTQCGLTRRAQRADFSE